MKKLAKRTAALACAMLMTAGGFSQVSAGSLSVPYYEAKFTGTAQKTGTTTATATTIFRKNTLAASECSVTARAYVKVNGKKQFGATEPGYDMSAANATATGQIYVSSGFGGTGYGGEHSAHFKVPATLGGGYKDMAGTSDY